MPGPTLEGLPAASVRAVDQTGLFIAPGVDDVGENMLLPNNGFSILSGVDV